MAAAFINQVPASSYGFDFTNIHGWAFLYRTTAPPRLWQGWGWRDILISYVEKTPGSLEAGGCGGCGMPTVNCAHNKSIEPEGNTSVHTPRMACEMSRTWMCVDIVSGWYNYLNTQCLLLCSAVYRRDSTPHNHPPPTPGSHFSRITQLLPHHH